MSLKQMYDELAIDYDQQISQSSYVFLKWFDENKIQFQGLNLKAVDFGCGTGLIGDLLKKAGATLSQLDGFDLSSKMLAEAQKKSVYSSLKEVDLNQSFPALTSQYDYCFVCGVSEFIEDLPQFLSNLSQNLKGAKLVMSFRIDEGQTIDHQMIPYDQCTLHSYKPDYILKQLIEVGCTNIQSFQKLGYISFSTKEPVQYLVVNCQI